MPNLRLKKSEEVRDAITSKTKKKINKLYKGLAKETKEKIKRFEGMEDSGTKYLQQLRLNQLKLELQELIKKTNEEVENIIKEDIKEVSKSVESEMNEFLEKINFNYRFTHISEDIIESVVNGTVYDKKWYLSKRIWQITEKEIDDINTIIAKGIADGSSTYDIAKDLEKYVNPSAKKDWEWSKVYPNTNKKIDYNAQRLARTLTQHAFQQSFEKAGEDNPFIIEYVWISAMIHGRTCQVCMDRDGQHYKKGELPLDHPNGLCTWAYVMEDLRNVAKRINEWRESPKGTYPEIDRFAETLEPLYKDKI